MQQRSSRIDEDLIKRSAQETDLQLIYKLDLSIQNLQRIEQLELVPKLRCLILSYNRVEQLEGLRVVPDLRELHAENNLLTRLGGLDGNKNLTVLNLANNQIERIEHLGALTRLDTLNLSHNRLTRLSGIDALKEMKQLYLQHNAIEVLEYIPAFSRLQIINLSHNRIKTILPNFFQNCSKLLRLDLSHNELKKVEFVEVLTNLEQLNLAHNRIEVFLPEAVYPHLDQLELNNNELSELPYFPNLCPELMSLNLADNYITNEVTLLQAIAGHQSLVELDFRNNPMYTESFESAVCKLHNLDIINGRAINQPGNKYKEKIEDIVREFREFPELYMRDDQEDRAIKLSGFYSQELELELTGIKPNRPQSPQRRMNHVEKNSEFIASQQQFKDWLQQTNSRVEQMRYRCQQIFKSHGIQPPKLKDLEELDQTSDTPTSSREVDSQNQLESLRLEQERQAAKWKEAKARDKGFNIRDLRKKKSIVQDRPDKPAGSLPKFIRKSEKMDMLKTQQLTAFDQKILNEAALARTQQRTFRPQSLKK